MGATEVAQAITFRPLSEGDLPRLTDWLNRPHLRRFYQPTAITLEAVTAKYLPRIRGEAPTRSHLALLAGEPFGYLQCYRNVDWPDWEAVIGPAGGVSIDLFIAEPSMLGRGLGRSMLRGYVEQVVLPMHPHEQWCWIGHDAENLAARACSEAAGFTYVRDYVEDGAPCVLLRRPLLAPDHGGFGRFARLGG